MEEQQDETLKQCIDECIRHNTTEDAVKKIVQFIKDDRGFTQKKAEIHYKRIKLETQYVMEGKYLITTDAWFYAPDSKQYKAVWGEIEILSDDILGIKTNVRSSNWFAKVGTEDNHVIIAGCQIHYACKSKKRPKTVSSEVNITDGVTKIEERLYAIYIAQ